MSPPIHFFLFIVLLTSASLAQVATPAPPELTSLRTRYRSDLQVARGPIRAKYVVSLENLWRTTTKSGDLDAALAIQQELNVAQAKATVGPGGRVTPELTDLKARYEADLQKASEGIQIRYITALQTLQESFTKRGNLPAAIAVRQELSIVKPEAVSKLQSGQSDPPKPPVGNLSEFKKGWKSELKQFLNVGIKELPGSGAGFYKESVNRFKQEAQKALDTDNIDLLKSVLDDTQQDMFDGWVNVLGSPFVRWGGRLPTEYGGSSPEYTPAKPLEDQIPRGGAYEVFEKLRKSIGLPPLHINTQVHPDKRPKR